MSDPTPKNDPCLIVLVRHGETTTTGQVLPGRATGLHLSDRGRQQAGHAAARLVGMQGSEHSRIAAVYASPLERTRETAKPIAAALDLLVQPNKALTECDFGEWTGRQLADLRNEPAWRLVQRYPSGFRFPGGESFSEMQHRIWQELATLAARHSGEAIVVVSHADPIKAVVAAAAGVHLDLFQRLVISPCSLTPILFSVEGPVILAVNSTGDDISTLVPS